ncbi:sugar nucleotide-binding protein [Polystyrenella longa]|uniref:sugar nucleotide-binding protein n=1 Tax=Polystyrenella longa TaxID=2528007 RepID=UPI0018D1FD04|nr:sugar nucleotide-binding protein [Polystyrenella longa]
MDTLLIAGIDSVAGYNIAVALSEQFHVIGLSFKTPILFEGEETELCPTESAAHIVDCLEEIKPDWILYCGPTACSSWDVDPAELRSPSLVKHARRWAEATRTCDSRFTVISSDAVFTGPWMFHREESDCYCLSAEAANIREMEAAIIAVYPQAMIVRTHVFGWTPAELKQQSIDKVLDQLETGKSFAGMPSSSPILTDQLAGILAKLEERQVSGLLHIGSAERCTPLQFASHVALEFDVAAPIAKSIGAVTERQIGFGQGESSLQCTKLRKVLGIGLPLVSDGIRLLAIQCEKQSQLFSGFSINRAA